MVKVWLVLLSVLLAGLFLGNADRAIDKIQEARIAETAREMVVDGDWLVPHYNGEVRLQKPPLTYWLTAVSYQLFGINERAARLPSALFAISAAWLMFIWVRRETSVQMAIGSVLVLGTSFLSLRYFRSGEADAALLFFISLASAAGFSLLEATTKKSVKTFQYAFTLALGLGFLTKGPAGIAIPLITVLVYAFSTKNLPALKSLFNPLALAIFVVLAFAWYAYILLKMPDLAGQFFGKQVDETFVSGTHKQPIYWYLAHAIEFFAPWSLLLIPAGIWCYQHRPLPKLVVFSLIWLGVVFALLTWTVNKQTQYALLFAPPIAILIAYYIEAATGKFYQFNRIIFWLLCAAVLGLVAFAIKKHGLAAIMSPIWLLILLVPFALKKIFKLTLPSNPILLVAVLACFGYLFSEQFLSKDSEKDDIKMLMQSAQVNAQLYQEKPGNGAVSFYAKRPIKVVDKLTVTNLLTSNNQFWLVAKSKPSFPQANATAEKTVGKWTLWKMTKQP